MPKSSYADFVKSHYNKKLSFKANTQAISKLWAKQKAGKGVVLEKAAKHKADRPTQKRRDEIATEFFGENRDRVDRAIRDTADETRYTADQIHRLRRMLQKTMRAQGVLVEDPIPGAAGAAAGDADDADAGDVAGPAHPPHGRRMTADRTIAQQRAKTPPPRRRQKGEGNRRGLGKVVRSIAKLSDSEFATLRNAMVAQAGSGGEMRCMAIGCSKKRRGPQSALIGRGRKCRCKGKCGGETSQEMAAARPPPERSEAQARMAAEQMAKWKKDYKDREDKAPKISEAMKELLKKPRRYCTMGMDAASRRCRGERVPGIDDFQ